MHTKGQCRDLARLMMPLWRALQDAEQDATRAADLSHWSYIILADVQEHPGTHQKAVAERIVRTPSRVATDVEKLRADGLLVRTSAPDDRRANQLRLTDRGDALTDSTRKQIHAAEARLLRRLTSRQQRLLRKLLTQALDPQEL